MTIVRNMGTITIAGLKGLFCFFFSKSQIISKDRTVEGYVLSDGSVAGKAVYFLFITYVEFA